MKNYLFIALLFLMSCDPSTTTVTVPPVTGSISYNIDSTTYSWSTGNYGFLGSSDTCEVVVFAQQNPSSAASGVTIQIITDTLRTQCYYDTTAKTCNGKLLLVAIEHNNITYGSFLIQGKTWVEFTSITDTTVSGTFAGRLWNTAVTSYIDITDGEFSNVRISRN